MALRDRRNVNCRLMRIGNVRRFCLIVSLDEIGLLKVYTS